MSDARIDAPALIDLVHELHTALYGSSWARPQPPKDVWEMLLAEVRTRASECEKLKAALAAVLPAAEIQHDGAYAGRTCVDCDAVVAARALVGPPPTSKRG